MKTTAKQIYLSILSIFFVFFFDTAAAEAPHSVQALEHAVAAETHGKLGHSKEFRHHATKAIDHTNASEKAHNDAHVHITEAIKHLKETVKHGEMGHSLIALHAKESLKHAELSEKAHADSHHHMTEANRHLNEALEHDKAGHPDLTSEHTRMAIDHIKSTF